MNVLHSIRRYLTKPHVRPWALSSPILVLLICLPLLRPLRHPDPREMSNDEVARLATVQSLGEHHTLAIESADNIPAHGTLRRGAHTYSEQPPALAVLLSGPYWVMTRCGLTFATNPSLVAYLLTLIGATVPVAAAAGLIYRMGRLFELPRKRRAALGAIVVFGGGLVSYATVINPQAPAAALLLGSAACIIHVAIARRPNVTSGWLAVGGMCAAFAATIYPPAVVFLILLACAVPFMRWHWGLRAGGLALYTLGAIGPLVMHGMLMQPITGSYLPQEFHPPFATETASTTALADRAIAASANVDDSDDNAARVATWWTALGVDLGRLFGAFFGDHGILTHFPAVILGAFGVAAVMHRHWPRTSKVLAAATVAGGVAIIILVCLITLSGPGAGFGPQAFIVFLPLTLFWAGAWMRRPHHSIKWALAGVLIAFSAAVTILGATDPIPRDGYAGYTVSQAVGGLMHPSAQTSTVLAGR